MYIAIDLAHLIGIFIGLTLYGMFEAITICRLGVGLTTPLGVYAVTFLATLAVIHRAAGRARIVHATLLALFILCTAYYGAPIKVGRANLRILILFSALATYDIYRAFIKFRLVPGPAEFLSSYEDAVAPSKE